MPTKTLDDIERAQDAGESTWRPPMMAGTTAGSSMRVSAPGMLRGFASQFRLAEIADPDAYAVRATRQDIDRAIGDLMILATRHIRDRAKRGDLQRRLDAFTHEIMEAITT